MIKVNRKLNIAILTGGISSERKVSIDSGKNVLKSLLASKKYNPCLIEITPSGNWIGSKKEKVTLKPHNLRIGKIKIDLAFIALHGSFGEDGTIQGLLEALHIPYTGSGITASALAINKFFSKKLFKEEGIPTPDFVPIYFDDWKNHQSLITQKIIKEIGMPLVLKPSSEGSSVGISIIKNKKQLKGAIKETFKFDTVILAEKYIQGREIQVGILGNEKIIALPTIEIITKREFFDYKAKYDSNFTQEITPALITKKQTKNIQNLCLKVYKLLGCQGFARVDTFLNEKGQFLVSEVNTVPGLTKNSLFLKEAKTEGIEFKELIEKIIELGINKSFITL